MSIRNQNWYNLQSTRRYPLDDNSTGIDDAGNLIRDDILVDCNIRFPNTLGKYCYVQGITVSPGLVTILFGAADELDAAGVTICAVTITKPAASSVNYEVTEMVYGVYGWITLGPGIEHNFVGRYSTPRQSLVNPRNAKTYRPLPIPTIKKLQMRTALQNIVRLSGAQPVTVRYAENAGDVIDMTSGTATPVAADVPAIIIELDQLRRTELYDPLRAFLGQCGQRPESGTCPEIPIESINGIAPDCDGNIEIAFEGFAEPQLFLNCGGLDLLTDTDLPAVCAQTKPLIGDPAEGGGGGSAGGGASETDECCTPDLIVATEAELQTIPPQNRVPRLLVRTEDTKEYWELQPDLVTWRPAPAQEDCVFPNPAKPRTSPPELLPAAPATDDATGADAQRERIVPDIVIDQTLPASRAAYPCMLLPACWDFVGCYSPEVSHAIPFYTLLGAFELVSKFAPALCPCEHILGPENPGAVKPDKEAAIYRDAFENYSEHSVYAAKNLTGLSLASLQNCPTDWGIGKNINVEFRVETAFGRGIGGLFLNLSSEYGPDNVTAVLRHIAVVYDAKASKLKILRYRYFSPTTEAEVDFRLAPSSWCRIAVTPILNGDSVQLTVSAQGLPYGALQIINISIPLERYGDITGAVGLFADRSRVYFNRMTIVNEYPIIIDDTDFLPT